MIMNSPLVVLSQYVYAKRHNGGLYPGTVESKESDNSYRIAFQDYRKSKVYEKNELVWLGFYNFPPEDWSKSQMMPSVEVQGDENGPVRAAKKEGERDFPSRYEKTTCNLKTDVDSALSPRAEAIRMLNRNSKEWDLEQERLSKERSLVPRECMCVNDGMENSRTMPIRLDRTKKQVRSSVLRLNRKALSKELYEKHSGNSTSSSPIPKKTTEELWAFNERKDVPNYRHCSLSPHSYDRYDFPCVNPAYLTPPPTPGSLPPPLFVCKPYESAAFKDAWSRVNTRDHEDESWRHVDKRDVGGGKRRRRDNMKKCRKVYGIDNRDLWCTQCKWKKACTRFQVNNYSELMKVDMQSLK